MTENRKDAEAPSEASQTREPWERPCLVDRGQVSDLIGGGGGKTNFNAVDTGDIRKPRGHG
jgi:hypothetical protein